VVLLPELASEIDDTTLLEPYDPASSWSRARAAVAAAASGSRRAPLKVVLSDSSMVVRLDCSMKCTPMPRGSARRGAYLTRGVCERGQRGIEEHAIEKVA